MSLGGGGLGASPLSSSEYSLGAAAATAAAGDGSGSIDEITLISRQQAIINELRIRSVGGCGEKNYDFSQVKPNKIVKSSHTSR